MSYNWYQILSQSTAAGLHRAGQLDQLVPAERCCEWDGRQVALFAFVPGYVAALLDELLVQKSCLREQQAVLRGSIGLQKSTTVGVLLFGGVAQNCSPMAPPNAVDWMTTATVGALLLCYPLCSTCMLVG